MGPCSMKYSARGATPDKPLTEPVIMSPYVVLRH